MFRKAGSMQLNIKTYTSFNRACSHIGPNNVFDIIISGGGLIGQTMAGALSKNPLFKNASILLIESSSKQDYSTPNTYSNRVSSIVPSTKELLNRLGIWKNIKRYQEVNDMKVWGSFSTDYAHFVHEPEKTAFIVENDEIINSAIIENFTSRNIKILFGKSISRVTLNFKDKLQQHEIELDDKTVYKGTLLIGADGANSLIRKTMGANYISWKYNQFGIVATINLPDDGNNNTAWQRFLPDGPVAILPLKNGQSSLVWSVPEKAAKTLLKLPDEAFVDALNDALNSPPKSNSTVNTVSDCCKSILGTLKFKNKVVPLTPPFITGIIKGSRAMFPLGFGHSSEYYKPGVVLVGDSAHRVHPLAGQGVNIGFRDIICLEKNLSQGIMDGRGIGNNLDLKHYETEAQKNNIPIMAAIDMFHRIYTSDNGLVRAFGNSCFHVADSFTPIKSVMRNFATN